MPVYYNEHNQEAALWLKESMKDGYIPEGDIDTRDIQEVQADDLRGYTQHHFFAGIGGWSIALRLAGWPDSRPICTGSCPCQPFSGIGGQKGQRDERHLWPEWHRIIKEFRFPTIFGEQVRNAITFGWLDELYDDLEKDGYACASAVLPAIGAKAPHERYRLYFVANSFSEGLERHAGNERRSDKPGWQQEGKDGYAGKSDTFLSIKCRDGRERPTIPGVHLLADGIPHRLRKAAIQGFGNAIVPTLAARFIRAYMECDYAEMSY